MITPPQTSTLEKLKIIAYKDVDYQSKVDECEVMVNPEELVRQFDIEYQSNQGQGTTGTELKFKRILPGALTLNILFDATGALNFEANITDTEPVADQLEHFLNVVKYYDGSTHNTYYLSIIWGTFIFKGKLTGLNITYSLFKPDGTPLRANARATFHESVSDDLRVNLESKSSPDLTHIRTVKAGDTLPLMTYRIYGDFSYYLEIAKVNDLKNYRNLEPGTQLIFPPVNNETE